MIDIIIIGGGASGLSAAISAKRTNNKNRVVVIESLDRVGKKILATGNGRCNLTNLNAKSVMYNDVDFTQSILNNYSPEKVIVFFNSIGLMTVSDSEGRVYPMSNTATSVLDCLRFEVENCGVEFVTESHVDSIEKSDNLFIVNEKFKAKKVIIATGGKSSPSQGSDGSGYKLLKSLGHTITDTYPALVQLTVKEKIVKSLKGMRVKCNVTLYDKDYLVDKSSGELLFTDYGLSGIAIMDISRSVKAGEYTCFLDMLPKLTEDEIVDFILSRLRCNNALKFEDILCGLLPRRVSQCVIKRANCETAEVIAKMIKNFKFTVNGTKGFSNSQVTSGGAELKEFDPDSLESLKIKDLYCCGEVLNVDSICGGFNLHWAWASGITAGKCASV